MAFVHGALLCVRGSACMILVRLLGEISLEGAPGGLSGQAARRHPLALLSLLASAQRGWVSREKLVSYLWPEKDATRARNLLNQAVHALRKALGSESILSRPTDLGLNGDRVISDVGSFEAAISEGDLARAVPYYRGPFLDGFFLRASPEFDRWMEKRRARLRWGYLDALEELADQAASKGRARVAVKWWRRFVLEDPYNARVTLRLMEVLESLGEGAAAIRLADGYAEILQADLGAMPEPRILFLAERIRSEPARGSPETGSGSGPTARFGLEGGLGSRSEERRRGETADAAPGVSRGLGWRIRIPALVVVGLVLAIGGVQWLGQRRDSGPGISGLPGGLSLATPDLQARQFYRRGLALLDDPMAAPQARSDAEWMLRQAVRLDPSFAEAWAMLAEWHSSAVVGRWALALAIHRPPTDPSPGTMNSDSAMGMALRYGPMLPETKRAEGWYAFNVERDHEKALARFEEARHEWPADPELSIGMGLIRISDGRWEEGAADLARAAALDPGSYWRDGLLAQTYAHMGRYEEAERFFDRALSVAPAYVEGHIGKAILRVKRDGDVRGALQVLDDAVRVVDPGELVFVFTQVMGRHAFVRILNDFFQAEIADSAVVQHLRDRCHLCERQLQAELAEARGDLEVARAVYRGILRDRLDVPGGDLDRLNALSCAAVGRYEEAVRWVRGELEDEPLSQEAVSGYHRLLTVAEVQLRVGDAEGAIETLQTLLLHPGLLSGQVLSLDPLWDPIRNQEGFRQLVDRF